MVIYSPRETAAMSRWMHGVFAHTKPMPALRKGRRIVSTVGEEIARLVAPLL